MNNRTMKRYAPIFLLPTMIAFAIGFIAPFILGVYLSFCEFTTVTDAKFVGFKNYIRFWNDPSDVFLHSLGFTVLFTIVTVVLINVIGFAVALALTKKIKGTNLFRTVFFMPNLIGGLVLGYVWQNSCPVSEKPEIFRSVRLRRTCDPDVLAADWLYDDHLYFRYSEYPGRAD